MNNKQYLKNQIPMLSVNFWGVLALSLFLLANGNPPQTIAFISTAWVLILGSYLLISYFIEKGICASC